MGTIRRLLARPRGAGMSSPPRRPAGRAGQRVLGFEILSSIDEDEAEFFDRPDPSFSDLRPLLRPGALVLDLGCGRGRNLEHLKAQGLRAVALDCNADHVAHVRATRSEEVVLGNMFRGLPFEDGHIDAVVAWQVLCEFSIPSVQLLFEEIHRVLAEGGLMVLAGCYGNASWHGVGARVVDSCPVLPPTFDSVRAQILEPIAGWPHLRWLHISRKVAASKIPERAESATRRR